MAYVSETKGAELSPLATKGDNMEYAKGKGYAKLVCFENKNKTVFMI